MGIEPTLAAWEAAVLPLNYTRMRSAHCKPVNARRFKVFLMQIRVNGESRMLTPPCSVQQLIDSMPLQGRRVAVERNGDIVPRSAHASTWLAEGDRVEIVQAIGGG